jgi:NAD+ diphosphatase
VDDGTQSSTPLRAWFLVHPQGLVVRREGDVIAMPTEEDVAALGVAVESAHFLGSLDGNPAFGTAVPEGASLTPPLVTVGPTELRELYKALGERRWTLAGMANQLVQWAAAHAFCGRCATPTERLTEERAMRCPKCGLMAYPRISPAVIVLVRRGPEALLARGARFPLPFYSTLAGFVEVGETLEETVAREIREEVGIEVKDVRYFGSQPWPFPHSLMVGFTAEWAGGEITPDPREIVDAKWFGRDNLPTIPPRLSIARRLIDDWLQKRDS